MNCKVIGIFILFFLLIFLFNSCATTTDNRPLYIPIQRPMNHPIKRLTVKVIGKSDFPIAEVENIIIQELNSKGYDIVSREELLKQVLKEQDIKGKSVSNYSTDVLGADAMFFLEVTQWKTERHNGVSSIQALTMVGKLVDTESGKIIWVKNDSPPSTNLIQQVFEIPVVILVGQRNPLSTVLYSILDSFPPYSNR